MRDLLRLPKAHLHLHLEGGMRPSTLQDLAGTYGLEVPDSRGFGSFSAFAATYLAACDVLRTPDDLARLVRETVEDAAAEGVVWIEPAFYAPHHNDRLGPDEAVIEIVLDALASASAELGVAAGLMLTANRVADPAIAVRQAVLAVQYADQGVVSFGLANDESQVGPAPFEEAFAVIRGSDLLSTPHAGELAGPESVLGAIDLLGADRIQHGVRAVEDPVVLSRLADEGICCDVCPTSNLLLSVVPSIEEHPLVTMLDAGVPCSINADDPLLFGASLLDEYQLCRDQLGLDDARLADVASVAIQHSGAPDSLRAATAHDIDQWIEPSRG